MKYQIDEIYIKNKSLNYKKAKKTKKSDNNIAIVIHLFYIDIWEKELNSYLSGIKVDFDLFLTVTGNTSEEKIKKIFKKFPNAKIYMVENRGRDVLPFLQVLNLIDLDSYKYICKLHTKKTGESSIGDIWRKMLYFDLIGSNKTVKNILKIFDGSRSAGMVTGRNSILSAKIYDFDNSPKVKELAQKCDIEYIDDYNFAAGTMFWFDPKIMKPLLGIFRNDELEFEKELGQTEKTLAHALERFFGLLCYDADKTIEKSLSNYSSLDDKTLDEMASLVLSQTYIDFDEYIRMKKRIEEQDRWIKKQDKWIKELEDIAQSLRIKNRIKRLYPKGVIEAAKAVSNNPQLMKKVLFHLKQGNINFLISRAKEKLSRKKGDKDKSDIIEPENIFRNFNIDDFDLGDLRVDIIIPIYNGMEFLPALFDSIKKNTTHQYRLIVVNDCSPDESVKPYLLKRLEEHPDSIFIDHETNQGFLKSVNEAREHVSNHFLILNTDTEVPKYWLERMIYPIVHMDKVASTTPFTNSGQIASFPNFIADNDIFEEMSVDSLDKAFREVNPDPFYTEVPTGVGFCMGVNYDLTQEIGFFVEEEFGKGYGEENDWCQRAISHGYTNLMVPNLFVYHKHGGSFSAEEKQKLMKENAIKLLHKHPNYDKDVETYVRRDPHKTLRKILVVVAASQDKEGIHLIIDQALGGGANHYTENLVENYLSEEKKVLRLIYDYYASVFVLHFDYKSYHYSFMIKTFEQVKIFISKLRLKEIFVNNLVSFQEPIKVLQWIETLARTEQTALTIPIHDYYPICQNYTLLNPQATYCGIPDSLQECQSCLKDNDLEWKTFVSEALDIEVWRKEWNSLLRMSNRIICFSNSSKELLLRTYQDLDSRKIVITPHKVDPLPAIETSKNKERDYTTLGVLGAINQAKGAGIIKELVEHIDREKLPIRVVLIGEISININSDHFLSTGRYAREDLPELVRKHGIDIFLLPSVCPETFSYTTQEIMMMEMPLMVFDIGAPPERVREYPKGIVFEKEYLPNIIKYLENFRNLQ